MSLRAASLLLFAGIVTLTYLGFGVGVLVGWIISG